MKCRDFCYWLQGFFEIANQDNITDAQVRMIQKHLNMVFKHDIDPSMGPVKHQEDLNKIHEDGLPGKDFLVRC